jgi:hypothetical protein
MRPSRERWPSGDDVLEGIARRDHRSFLDHRRQSFGCRHPVKFSKVSNIDQRAALPSRHIPVITALRRTHR